MRLIILLILHTSFCYSQEKILNIHTEGIKKGKNIQLDSICCNNKILQQTNLISNNYIFPKTITSKDSLLEVYLYKGKSVYIIKIPPLFFNYCGENFHLSFKYTKKKLYYILKDCTSKNVSSIVLYPPRRRVR